MLITPAGELVIAKKIELLYKVVPSHCCLLASTAESFLLCLQWPFAAQTINFTRGHASPFVVARRTQRFCVRCYEISSIVTKLSLKVENSSSIVMTFIFHGEI